MLHRAVVVGGRHLRTTTCSLTAPRPVLHIPCVNISRRHCWVGRELDDDMLRVRGHPGATTTAVVNTFLSDVTPRLAEGGTHVTLASSSKTRSRVLSLLGVEFDVGTSDFPEDLDKSKFSPQQYTQQTAHIKAIDVVRDKLTSARPVDLCVGVDTVLLFGGRIMEKPQDDDEALEMYRYCNGGVGHVISGVSLLVHTSAFPAVAWGELKDGMPHNMPALECSLHDQSVTARCELPGDHTENCDPATVHAPAIPGGYAALRFTEVCSVHLANISDDELKTAVEQGAYHNKAGGGHGFGNTWVQRIDGCPYNVIGFPLLRFCSEVSRLIAC